jgi:hypothetical protein
MWGRVSDDDCKGWGCRAGVTSEKSSLEPLMDGSRENASWRSRITYRRALVVSTAIALLLLWGIATAAVATQEVSLDSGSVS